MQFLPACPPFAVDSAAQNVYIKHIQYLSTAAQQSLDIPYRAVYYCIILITQLEERKEILMNAKRFLAGLLSAAMLSTALPLSLIHI